MKDRILPSCTHDIAGQSHSSYLWATVVNIIKCIVVDAHGRNYSHASHYSPVATAVRCFLRQPQLSHKQQEHDDKLTTNCPNKEVNRWWSQCLATDAGKLCASSRLRTTASSVPMEYHPATLLSLHFTGRSIRYCPIATQIVADVAIYCGEVCLVHQHATTSKRDNFLSLVQ